MKFPSRLFYGLATFMIVGLLPFLAYAVTTTAPITANDQIKFLAAEGSNVPKLIAVLCYVIGVFYTAKALLALKNFIANSDENPINAFLSYGAIGSLLIVLPFSIATVGNTLAVRFPQVESSQRTFEDEIQFKDDNFGPNPDMSSLEGLFVNLSLNFITVAKLLAIFAYVMAAVIMIVGLVHLKNYGDDPSQIPVRSIIMKFVLASMLVSLPFAMQIFVTTVTGASDIESQSSVAAPCLMNGSGLSAIRNRGTVICQ